MSATSHTANRPLWWDHLADDPTTRPPLTDTIDVDVAVVGAGYTGLWTAYYLHQHDPALSIAVIDRHHVGYGASGRNGGWCYDGFAAGLSRIEKDSDLTTACAFATELRATVDEVGRVAADEHIDCAFHKAGNVEFLRNGGQLARAREDVEEGARYGYTDRDARVVDAEEARRIGRAADVVGGLISANTASIQPARLVHGLAAAVERRGVTIYESTTALDIGDGVVHTDGGTIRAGIVVRSVEGYAARLPGLKRALAPLYSLMIGTEPLPEALWDDIGLHNREMFGDLRHLVVYGQRTVDGRVAFGGRGAPYDFGSRIRTNAEFPAEAFDKVRAALVEIFPQMADVAITHRWGGVLGVTRSWYPTAGIDRTAKVAWAGGYVGSGVAATNLAGRTLADLIAGVDSQLTRFPWVHRPVRKWEPEPLRWLGINGALRVMEAADREENRRGAASRRAEMLWRMIT